MKLERYVLANPEHRLPMPGSGLRWFRPTGETVDVENPFWLALIGDGSIVPAPPAAKKEEAKAPPKPPAKTADEPKTEQKG